jgi:hypothetical protein
VLVNVDGDDVAVPIASPSGVGPGKILTAKIKNSETNSIKSSKILASKEKEDIKLYYFSPFDQYAQNQNTQEVVAIDPAYDVEFRLEIYEANEKLSMLKEKNPETYSKILALNENIGKLEDRIKRIEYIGEADKLIQENLSKIEISKEKLESKKSELREELKTKLTQVIQGAKSFKKTEEFKKLKE